MTARVTEVSSSSVRREWSITVRRNTEYLGDAIEVPPIDDVPADIREALRQWLKSGEGLDGCWNFQPVNPLSTKTIEPDRGCRNCGRPYRVHV